MTHNLRISVSKEPEDGSVVSCKKVTLRERIISKLFGQKRKIMVLVPGDSVSSVSITEDERG